MEPGQLFVMRAIKKKNTCQVQISGVDCLVEFPFIHICFEWSSKQILRSYAAHSTNLRRGRAASTLTTAAAAEAAAKAAASRPPRASGVHALQETQARRSDPSRTRRSVKITTDHGMEKWDWKTNIACLYHCTKAIASYRFGNLRRQTKKLEVRVTKWFLERYFWITVERRVEIWFRNCFLEFVQSSTFLSSTLAYDILLG